MKGSFLRFLMSFVGFNWTGSSPKTSSTGWRTTTEAKTCNFGHEVDGTQFSWVVCRPNVWDFAHLFLLFLEVVPSRGGGQLSEFSGQKARRITRMFVTFPKRSQKEFENNPISFPKRNPTENENIALFQTRSLRATLALPPIPLRDRSEEMWPKCSIRFLRATQRTPPLLINQGFI